MDIGMSADYGRPPEGPAQSLAEAQAEAKELFRALPANDLLSCFESLVTYEPLDRYTMGVFVKGLEGPQWEFELDWEE